MTRSARMFADLAGTADDLGIRELAAGWDEPRAFGLVARDRELAGLDHLLWRARSGSAGVAALRGEPGTGKSALLEAAVARATGFTIVRLRGSDDWYRRDEWVRHLAGLLSEGEPAAQEPGVTAGAGGRSRLDALVDAAAASLQALVRRSEPVLVAIDDCHLLPPWFVPTFGEAVVGHLPEAPLALVVAWREFAQAEIPDLAVEGVEEYHLGGLTSDQARTLFERHDLAVPPADVLKGLVYGTAGNPAALLDAHAQLTEDEIGGWRPLPDPVPVGEGLVEAYASRLDGLDADGRDALLVAAAGGRVQIDVITAALRTLDISADALEGARQAGIVVTRGRRFEFAHPLVRAAAFFGGPALRRRQAHDALSKAFAAAGDVERSAFHAVRGATGAGDRTARLLGQAARVALDNGDMTAAARHQETAADFADDPDTTAHHLALAAANWLAVGNIDRARVCVERARGLVVSDGVRGEVLHQRSRCALAATVGTSVAASFLEAAGLSEREAPHRASISFADASACALIAGDTDGAIKSGERAVATARVVSSHAEALAQAALGAARVLGARSSSRAVEVGAPAALLMGQTQGFAGSAQLAYVVGLGLLAELGAERAARWGVWIERCAGASGDRSLQAAAWLLRATVATRLDRFNDARHGAEMARDAAASCGQDTLLAPALALLVEIDAALGSHHGCFEHTARLFGLEPESGRTARGRATSAIAELELQFGHLTTALSWLDTARSELDGSPGRSRAYGALWAPVLVEVLALGARNTEIGGCLGAVEEACEARHLHPGWLPLAVALGTDDIELAESSFAEAANLSSDSALLAGRVEFWWGWRMRRAGNHKDAADHLRRAEALFGELGARGWQALAIAELGGLSSSTPTASAAPGVPAAPTGGARDGRGPAPTRAYLIEMLGTFAVRHRDREVSLPPSLPSQALKIVALRDRIQLDELVELLWPDAEPGVGVRRLRNVLFRLRGAGGPLLVRDGNFIRLSPDATTDVAVFRSLAKQALSGRGAPDNDVAVRAARDAIALYHGELLPGDRYADWAASPRESLGRLHGQLLEMLVEIAVGEGSSVEALGLLEQLIEADPYEEHHYLQGARIHAASGNRRQAVSWLERAQRALADLGVPPSPAFVELRRSIEESPLSGDEDLRRRA